MPENLLNGELDTSAMFAVSDSRDKLLGVGPVGQIDQRQPQVLLKGASGSSGTSGQCVAGRLGYVANGD